MKKGTGKKKGLHKDWRTWLVVAVMLAAIGAYVLTLDDSIQPNVQTGGAGGAPAAQSKP